MREETKKFLGRYGKAMLAFLILLPIMVLLMQIFSFSRLEEMRVSFLDIGQGDAILVQTPSGHKMLIDGGANDTVLTRLSEELGYFDTSIDVLVATHPDADHVTGLIPVLERYNVKYILVSGSESDTGMFHDFSDHTQAEGAVIREAHKGDAIDFGDGVVATILHPQKGQIFKETNDASVSMVITYGDESFLLTGDLPSSYEDDIISNALPRKVTVYKAGHHGSKTSSGVQLLSYIKPEYAVVSAGKDNRYGHPNTDTMERLAKYAKETLSTIDRGTITFVMDGKSLELETNR